MARSTKKGPYVDPKLLVKVANFKEAGKRGEIKTWSRRSLIIPEFVGVTFSVHDGKKFISVFVTENMVGHYLGEFAATRKLGTHSGLRKSTATPAGK